MSVDNNFVYTASYDFRPENPSYGDSVEKRNAIFSFFQTLITYPLKFFIFSGASLLKYISVCDIRTENSLGQLREIGGEPVKLKTPDGDIIDGMYLSADAFKAKIEKYFYVVEREENGKLTQFFCVRPEFCSEKNGILEPNDELHDFIQKANALGLQIFPFLLTKENIQDAYFKISDVPKDIPFLDDEKASNPTALIAPGSAANYSVYKQHALYYLLKGMNVMLVDYRGYGKSEGSPTSYKTKLDLETAYQYLVEEKGLENKDLIVHAHCLGGGAATDLAARRKGVNLVLDRTFADLSEVAGDRITFLRGLISMVFSRIFCYDNCKNLSEVEGSIAIEMDVSDNIIGENQIMKQIDSIADTNANRVVKLMDSSVGHNHIWSSHPITSLQFAQFLQQANLRRRLF